MSLPVRTRRSLLFVPGNRLEAHPKALASGADTVCLDLEDAVPPKDKAAARAAAIAFLADEAGPERVVRINSPRSADGLRDVLAILESRPSSGVIFLPKVAGLGEVRMVGDLIGEAGLDLEIAVLIESLEGLENVASILVASPRIAFAMFGAADLSAELGSEMDYETLLYARSRVVHAARLAAVDLFDVPSLAFRDLDRVRTEALAARKLGFTGKAVLHPSNVAVANDAFAPDAEEIARAEAIIDAYRSSANGLAIVDGKLVERPVILAMERILARRDAIARSH